MLNCGEICRFCFYMWPIMEAPREATKIGSIKGTKLNSSVNRQIYVPCGQYICQLTDEPMDHAVVAALPPGSIGLSVNHLTYGPRGHVTAATSARPYVRQWRRTDERKHTYPSVTHHRRTYFIFIGINEYDFTFIGHIFIGWFVN
jgi:hypothetical protein